MSKQYVIVKSTTRYISGRGYEGLACEAAEVPQGKIYDSIDEAVAAAAKLSLASTVRFSVEEYVPAIETSMLENRQT